MNSPEDELDQFYRQSYRRLMIGSVVLCAVLSCAIAAGPTGIGAALLRQIDRGFHYINPRPIMETPVMRSSPNCAFKKPWSTAGVDETQSGK